MKILTVLISMSVLLLAHSVSAGSCNNCTVKSIAVGPHYDKGCSSESCAYIRVTPGTSGIDRTSCSANIHWHYVLDMSTTTGQMAYSQLLTAYAAKLPMHFVGLNTCSLINGSEDLGIVYFPW